MFTDPAHLSPTSSRRVIGVMMVGFVSIGLLMWGLDQGLRSAPPEQEPVAHTPKERSGPTLVQVIGGKMSVDARDELRQLLHPKGDAWGPRRVWLTSFREAQGKFTLEGGAFDLADVAAFVQRANGSRHFQDVQLDFTANAGQEVDWRVVGTLMTPTRSPASP